MGKQIMETPIQREKRLVAQISFSDRLEEELKEQLFKEGQDDTESHAEDYLLEQVTVHKARPGEVWDVPLTEEVKYFDPELSYELTGYRPITMEKGLDFDPTPFRERAITYNKKKKYTDYPYGCKPFKDFWDEEKRRCVEGYTVGKYRITGDHYFFINYYRMNVLREDAVAGSGRVESFPAFLSKQYE